MSEIIIGIDLGTTFSAAAIFRNGMAEIIPNANGERTTPSCVAFTEVDRLVGKAAAYQAADNPENTINGE
uniref:CSON002288 protein n=1 Tax=Culicoides sonorensis TaxID=179676 RepID=A0A336MIN2_CULSO